MSQLTGNSGRDVTEFPPDCDGRDLIVRKEVCFAAVAKWKTHKGKADKNQYAGFARVG